MPDIGPVAPDAGSDVPVRAYDSRAGHSRGISSSAGGSTGCCVHGRSASATTAGSW